VSSWTSDEISSWLKSLKLDRFLEQFKDVDGDVLLAMDEDMLKELGITRKMDQVQILAKVKRLKE